MSGWLTIDAACSTEGCGYATDLLVKREEAPDVGDWAGICPQCECPLLRVPSRPNPTRASFVDGKRRFDSLRAQDRLDRAMSEAKTLDERKKVAVEKAKLSDSKK